MEAGRIEQGCAGASASGRSGRGRLAVTAPVAIAFVLVANGCEPNSATAAGSGGAAGGGGRDPSVLDAGGPPPTPPDGEALCPSGICNYQSQSGCASTLACRPVIAEDSNVEPGCVAAGDRLVGETCEAWTDCAPGLLCAEGTCRRLCCAGDWSVCGDEESCIRQVSVPVGEATVQTGASLCYPVGGCDVLDPTSCGDDDGRTCQIVDARGKVACAPEGVGQAGDFCSNGTPCIGGFACVAERCRRLCRMVEGGEPACPPDEGTCVHFTRDPPGVGECTPL